MKKKTVFLLFALLFVTILQGCGPRETVVNNLGNAENSLFSPDGKLFITGSQIWQIKQNDQGYYSTALTSESNCTYAGIALYNNHLFAVLSSDGEGDAWLVRASLENLEFSKIYQLSGFTMANGMVVDTAGHLYISDETLINTDGKIVRLSLTDDIVPEVIEESYTVWLSGEDGAQSPNGLEIINNHLFFTNFDLSNIFYLKTSIKRVAITGDSHGDVETVFQRRSLMNSSFLDDMTSTKYNGVYYLIAADYLKGTVLAVEAFKDDQTKPLYEVEDDKFAGPTSCIVGQGLGFGEMDLLVTEGGIVSVDPDSSFGNRLSVVRYQP